MTIRTKSLETLFDNAAHLVLDSIAKEGLEILRSLLADAGFLRSEFLKNYELSARVEDDSITYEIMIDYEAISDESLEEMGDVETPLEDPNDPHRFTIPTLPSKVFARVQKLVGGAMGGARDARKSSRQNNDARIPATDARRDARKTSFDRRVERDVASPAPRKMRVNRQGKLVVAFRKKMEEENGEYKYPKGDFEGIIKSFLTELQSLLSEKFAPMLEEVIKRNLT